MEARSKNLIFSSVRPSRVGRPDLSTYIISGWWYLAMKFLAWT